MISIHRKRTFARLRYSLGGDRPSQTAHLPLSTYLIQGMRENLCHSKNGISPATPPDLTTRFQSLPSMLHILCKGSMTGYSKGSRGLLVPLLVTGIFTGTAISPSSTLRQRPDRYTIRAGRNLPDKEFRYLRTVIVTAAVYRGFKLQLRLSELKLTVRINLPAPGRCQSLYIILRFSRDLCFW